MGRTGVKKTWRLGLKSLRFHFEKGGNPSFSGNPVLNYRVSGCMNLSNSFQNLEISQILDTLWSVPWPCKERKMVLELEIPHGWAMPSCQRCQKGWMLRQKVQGCSDNCICMILDTRDALGILAHIVSICGIYGLLPPFFWHIFLASSQHQSPDPRLTV